MTRSRATNAPPVSPGPDRRRSSPSPTAGNVCPSALRTDSSNCIALARTLSGGTIEPPAAQTRRPSLIIRPVPAALPVWEVAKQYGTSVASVCAANGLTGDEIEAGTLLLIPME